MFRLIFIVICIYALSNTELGSEDVFESGIYPFIALIYVFFLIIELIVFFRSSGIDLMKELSHDSGEIASSLADLVIAVFDDRSEKYRGKFGFLGSWQGSAEDLGGYMEFFSALYAFFKIIWEIAAALSG